MYPFPRHRSLNVGLFLSIFDVENTLSEITLKLSFILRVAFTFRVSKIYWINDSPNSKKLKKIIMDITKYASTPPYLKKYIPINPNLKKVGMMSPLNLFSHIVSKLATEGEIRLGYKGDYGISKKLRSPYNSVLITDSVKIEYTPYISIFYDRINMEFIEFEKIFDLENIIISSRNGKNPLKNMNEIVDLYKKDGLTLIIGPPYGHLLEKLGENFLERAYNFAINQGVSDIRAEEALAYSLAILNILLS
ncbi:MAG: putative RNA uridine N3 methyltransferase [Saccharolobus sp.]